MEQSWLCEFILITNVRTDRKWFFPCNKWLSLYPPGDGLSIELYPNDQGLQKEKKPKNGRPEKTGKNFIEFKVVSRDVSL